MTSSLNDRRLPTALAPALAPLSIAIAALVLVACGGSSGETEDPAATATGPDGQPALTDADGATAPDDGTGDPVPIPGDIALYGIVAIGDTAGDASGDALASFSRLSTSVGPAAFGAALDPSTSLCTVTTDGGEPNLNSLSRQYLPVPDAVSLEPVDAGDAVLISSDAGSWLELQARPSDTFYTQSSDQAVPEGAVPAELVANITGATFPPFADAAFPLVTPLEGFDHGDGNVTRDTRFTWESGDVPNARVRIETATDGGFFTGVSTNVFCLVPDTGDFSFSSDTRDALGEDFDGTAPETSRIAISSVQEGDALLVLVRESFVAP